jgi:heme-degrading monooxygenase HmoA
MSVNSDWHYAILWEFQVRPEFRLRFEQVYGPNGEWAQFFRSSSGYFRTELIHDESSPNRYVTIDLWRSREDYEAFRQQHAEEYHRIDQRCEQMTEAERALGTFKRVSPLS